MAKTPAETVRESSRPAGQLTAEKGVEFVVQQDDRQNQEKARGREETNGRGAREVIFRIPESKHEKSPAVFEDMGRKIILEAAKHRGIIKQKIEELSGDKEEKELADLNRKIQEIVLEYAEREEVAETIGNYDPGLIASLRDKFASDPTLDVLETFPSLRETNPKVAKYLLETWANFVAHRITDQDSQAVQVVVDDRTIEKIEWPSFLQVLDIAVSGIEDQKRVPLTEEEIAIREGNLRSGMDIWLGKYDLPTPAGETATSDLAKQGRVGGEAIQGRWDWIGTARQGESGQAAMTTAEQEVLRDRWLIHLAETLVSTADQGGRFDALGERNKAIMMLAMGEEPPKPVHQSGTDWNEIGQENLYGPNALKIKEFSDLVYEFNKAYTFSGEPEPKVKVKGKHISDFMDELSSMTQLLYYKYADPAEQTRYFLLYGVNVDANEVIKEMEQIRKSVINFLYDHLEGDYEASAKSGSWEDARDKTQPLGMEITRRIQELFRRVRKDKDGNNIYAVADAFRLIAQYRGGDRRVLYHDPRTGIDYFGFVDAPLEQREVLLRMISWQLWGYDENEAWLRARTPPPGGINPEEINDPDPTSPNFATYDPHEIDNPTGEHRNPGGEENMFFQASYAYKIFEMTWLGAEWGLNSPYYAWRTHTLEESIGGSAYIHPIYKTGKGLEVLKKNVRVDSWWEFVANQVDTTARWQDLHYAQYPSVQTGLRVVVDGNLEMTKDWTTIIYEKIPFDLCRRPPFPIVAAQGARADKLRSLATKGGHFLDIPDLRDFLGLVASVEIFEDLKGVDKAEAVLGFFEVIADYSWKMSGKPNFINYHVGGFNDFLDTLRNLLDMTDPTVREMYERVNRKYRNRR